MLEVLEIPVEVHDVVSCTFFYAVILHRQTKRQAFFDLLLQPKHENGILFSHTESTDIHGYYSPMAFRQEILQILTNLWRWSKKWLVC